MLLHFYQSDIMLEGVELAVIGFADGGEGHKQRKEYRQLLEAVKGQANRFSASTCKKNTALLASGFSSSRFHFRLLLPGLQAVNLHCFGETSL